jgi:MbtH protein
MGGRMKVLRNRSGEYAIWPADRENALGWSDVGKTGSAEECQRHIEEVWTDLRPLSLRQRSARLEEMERKILRDGGR